MRKITLALLGTIAFAIGATSVASAADLPPRQPPMARAPVAVPAPIAFNWTGCYIGIHGGYGWGTKTFSDDGGDEFTSHDVSGGLAGGQVGCNYQSNRLVIGIEGQASWANLEGNGDFQGTYGVLSVPTTLTMHTKVDALGTIAARLGIAFDRTMLYAKGGAAFALDKHWLVDLGNTVATVDSYTRWGWMAGVGLEHAFTHNWSFKFEYNYMGLGKKTVDICDNIGCDPIDVRQDLHVVKAGINYRFGGGNRVSARY